MLDFTAYIEKMSNIVLLTPQTDAANGWLDENIGDEAIYLHGALVVETSYIEDIIDGIEEDGLEVQRQSYLTA